MKKTELHRHFLISLAFILCLIIFVLPTAVDLYCVQLITGHFLNAFFAFLICLAIVLVPLTIGNNLTKKYPEKYLRSKLVIAVWIIIGLHLIFFALSMYNRLILK